MPKYKFKCPACNEEREKYTSKDIEEVPCHKCEGQPMFRQLPTITGQEVRETVDPILNTKWKQDHKQIIKDRHDDHYWEVEVPRLVQKYSVETCLEQQWLIYNEKGELVINKPPKKR